MDPLSSIYFYCLKESLSSSLQSFNPELARRAEYAIKSTEKLFNSHKKIVINSRETYENALLSLSYLLTQQTLATFRQRGGNRHTMRAQRPMTHKVPDRKRETAFSKKQHREKHQQWLQQQYLRGKEEEKRWKQVSEELYQQALVIGKGGLQRAQKPTMTSDALYLLFFYFAHLVPLINNISSFQERLALSQSHIQAHMQAHIQTHSQSHSLAQSHRQSQSLIKSELKQYDLIVATQLANPQLAAAELTSAFQELGRSSLPTSTPENECPTIHRVGLTGQLKIGKENLGIIRELHLISRHNVSIGEFGCQLINKNGAIIFDNRLLKGDRGSVPVNTSINRNRTDTTIASCHLHPSEPDRIESPPSAADIRNTLLNALVYRIPYEFVFTQRGLYVIKVQDNILNAIESWLQTDFPSPSESNKYFRFLIPIMETMNNPDKQAQIEFQMRKYMECENLPSGKLSVGNNVIDVTITSRTNSVSKVEPSGFDIYFITNHDLQQGKMIDLSWHSRFAKLKSVGDKFDTVSIPNNGLSGPALTEALIERYDMGFTEQAQLFRNQIKPPQRSFVAMWRKIQENPELERRFVNIIAKNATNLFQMMYFTPNMTDAITNSRTTVTQHVELAQHLRLEYTSTPNYLNEVQAIINKENAEKAANNSILNKAGMISKMILGENATETIFMVLPYPLNLLKFVM